MADSNYPTFHYSLPLEQDQEVFPSEILPQTAIRQQWIPYDPGPFYGYPDSSSSFRTPSNEVESPCSSHFSVWSSPPGTPSFLPSTGSSYNGTSYSQCLPSLDQFAGYGPVSTPQLSTLHVPTHSIGRPTNHERLNGHLCAQCEKSFSRPRDLR